MSQGDLYNVDIAMCIDATGSMAPLIDEVKRNALRLHADIVKSLAEKDKQVGELRVRVIQFRDVRCDAEPLLTTPFFVLPDEEAAFASFVSGIEATGGGDAPESGLHALAVALGSDWTSGGVKRRHIVIVWTDTSSHPLEEGHFPVDLQTGAATTFDELTEQWEVGQGSSKLQPGARRLVLFAPDDPSWNQISDNWEQVVHLPSAAGAGLADVDYSTIIDTIGNSI